MGYYVAEPDLFVRVRDAYRAWGWEVDEIRELPRREFEFRVHCMMEELSEYVTATTHAERLDALIDLVVFALGTAVRHGYERFEAAFHEVMDANEQKEAGAVLNQRGESIFDLRKPDGWEAPDLRKYVGEAPLDLTRARELSVSYKPMTEEERATAARVHEEFQRSGPTVAVTGEQKEIKMHRECECTGECKVHSKEGDSVTTFMGYTADQIMDMQAELDAKRAELVATEHARSALSKLLLDIPKPMRDAAALLAKKTQDYNRGKVSPSRRDYHPYGHKSYLQMLWTKFHRLESVAEQDSVNFESARDSALDLINYACFYAAWLEEEEGNGLRPMEAASHPDDGGFLVDEANVEYRERTQKIMDERRLAKLECEPAMINLREMLERAKHRVSREEESDDGEGSEDAGTA